MMPCPYCGAPTEPGQRICSACGRDIGGTTPVAGGGPADIGPSIKFVQHLKDPKTKKAALSLKGMFKSLDAAVPGLGTFISMLPGLEAVLKPIFLILKPFEPFLKVLGGLLTALFGEALKPIMAFLKPFLPLLMKLQPLFVVIGKAIGLLIVGGLIPLILAIYAVGVAIAFLIDLFTFGQAHAVESWNATMLPAIGAGLAAVPGVMAMQSGGYVPARPGGTLVVLGEGGQGEHVIPESEMEELVFQARETNRLLCKIKEEREWDF